MIDPEWASWFRGFFDGEGCLWISKDGVCIAELKLRNDDSQVIYEIQDVLGGYLGKVSYAAERAKGRTAQDQLRWRITGSRALDAFRSLEASWQFGSWESWFCGFFEAEGNLSIKLEGCLIAQIGLRKDDEEIITQISSYLGGNVHNDIRTAARSRGAKEQDQIKWQLSGKNALPLVHCLEGKMRTKKKVDFDIWKEALEVSVSINDGKPSPLRRPIMLEYKKKLEDARKAGRWIEPQKGSD